MPSPVVLQTYTFQRSIYIIKIYTWRLKMETLIHLHVYLYIFQISSVKSKLWLYIRQYLELWKVTIWKTTRLSIDFWEHIYISLEKNTMEEPYYISISPFLVRHPVDWTMNQGIFVCREIEITGSLCIHFIIVNKPLNLPLFLSFSLSLSPTFGWILLNIYQMYAYVDIQVTKLCRRMHLSWNIQTLNNQRRGVDSCQYWENRADNWLYGLMVWQYWGHGERQLTIKRKQMQIVSNIENTGQIVDNIKNTNLCSYTILRKQGHVQGVH